MRPFFTLAALLVLSCSTGYRVASQAFGIEAPELAGARRLYFGESAHIGMPHVTVDSTHASRAAIQLKRELPDVEIVATPEDAEFIVSVLFNSEAACSHCVAGPESQWVALIERGGAAHRSEYEGLGPFLELSGHVGEGENVTRGFVRQLRELLRPRTHGTAG